MSKIVVRRVRIILDYISNLGEKEAGLNGNKKEIDLVGKGKGEKWIVGRGDREAKKNDKMVLEIDRLNKRLICLQLTH